MTFRVRTGGLYKRRDGEIVGPAAINAGPFPWRVGGLSYTNEGKFFFNGKPDPLDLIEEVSPVEARRVPRFDAVPVEGAAVTADWLDGVVEATRAAIEQPQPDPQRPVEIAEGKSYRLGDGRETGPLKLDTSGYSEWRSSPPSLDNGKMIHEVFWTSAFLRDHAIEVVVVDPLSAHLAEWQEEPTGLEFDEMPPGRSLVYEEEIAPARGPVRGHSREYADANLVIADGVIIKMKDQTRQGQIATAEDIEAADLIVVNGVTARTANYDAIRDALRKANERIADLSRLISGKAEQQVAEANEEAVRDKREAWDCFAAHALAGILGCYREYHRAAGSTEGRTALAAECADAMMIQRAKRGL